MSSLQARSLSRPPAASIVDTSARLELLEYFLVHSDDVALCAQASLEWLADNAGVKRSMCLAVDAESSALVGIAGHGVPAEDVELYSWSLERHDPLVVALSSSEPTAFKATRANGNAQRDLVHAARPRSDFRGAPPRLRQQRRLRGRPPAAASAHRPDAGRVVAGDGARAETRATARARQPCGGSPQAAPRAGALLHDHQRRHRPDSADRHRKAG